MQFKPWASLVNFAIVFIITATGLHIFSKIYPGIRENRRMERVARILEQCPSIINTYGPNCNIKPLKKGLQMAAVLHGEFYHVSPFEVMTLRGPKVIMANWSGWEDSVSVTVGSFQEVEKL